MNLKAAILYVVFNVQKFLVKLSYVLFKCYYRYVDYKSNFDVVVGVEEIASVLKNISAAIPTSTSVNFSKSPYYNYKYDIDFSNAVFPGGRHFITPILFAKLAASHKCFIYIGTGGFLVNRFDGREFEFKFLKDKNLKILSYFTGSEIRSHDLLNNYAQINEIDVITTYQKYINPQISSISSELDRKLFAQVSEEYSDGIFNAVVDQMTYINRDTYPFLYFYPDEKIGLCNDKWINGEKIKILHAPSSPILKGTPLVRAAIKKLICEGYEFEYKELTGVTHVEVIDALRSSHIVLNEFYAFVPGVFGIEAMANNCVLLTSADPEIETTLGEDAKNAWVITPYWLIYDKLKSLLDNKESLQAIANKGTFWTQKNCSYSENSRFIKKVIYD